MLEPNTSKQKKSATIQMQREEIKKLKSQIAVLLTELARRKSQKLSGIKLRNF
jgi:hypothetical protein